jgi:hypothetical protein
MKATKFKIAEKPVSGGLNDLEQRYRINYLEREEGYPDKVEIAIFLTGKDKNYCYRSLRFSSENQLKEFIKDLSQAYLLFQIKRTPKEMMSEQLAKDYISQLLNEINNKIIEMLK